MVLGDFLVLMKEKGFTLVELLWVMSFIVIVLTAAYLIFESGLTLSQRTEAQIRTQEETRKALRIMTRYARQAENLLSDEVTASAFGFSAELDGNNATTEWVHFYLSGTDLMMQLEETVTIETRLAQDVKNEVYGEPLFTYYDVNGNEIENVGDRPSDTKRVKMKIITETTATQGPYSLETDVFLRNR
jgi:prepilin-type N-terminal cleavage/methylation domain-containing protein